MADYLGGLGLYAYHPLNCFGLQRPFFGIFCVVCFVVPVVGLSVSSSWFQRRVLVVAISWTLYFVANSMTSGAMEWFYTHFLSMPFATSGPTLRILGTILGATLTTLQ